MRVSEAQRRVLMYCRDNGPAVTMVELNSSRLLHKDDVVTVPSLIEDGLLEHIHDGIVKITPAGRKALEESSDVQ
jgi:Mn-dependent DtxR family transcriptional regulator